MTSRTTIHGSNNQTPGVMTAPSTLLTSPDNNTGLAITQHATAPATQVPLRVTASGGSALAEVTNGLDFATYGLRLGAVSSVFYSPACLDGTGSIPFVRLQDGNAGTAGIRIYGGTGAPSSTTVGTASVGDLYLRKDTPSTANQRLYVCTVAGTPGTWTAIA